MTQEPVLYPVTTMAEIHQDDGDMWVTRSYDVQGNITVPPSATWTGESITWQEQQHLLDFRCPVCRSASPCLQQVTIYPVLGHVLVVHDMEEGEGEFLS